MANLEQITVTVLNGQTVSDAADLRGKKLVAMETPSALDQLGMSLLASSDGVNFLDFNWVDVTGMPSRGAIQLRAPRLLAFDGIPVDALEWVKIKVGTAPGSDQQFKLLVRSRSCTIQC